MPVGAYQMWESSGMGSLDLVKKFFAMDPGKQTSVLDNVAREPAPERLAPPRPTLTQDESAQVRLQTLELVCVILQLFLSDPPGVIVGTVRFGLLVQLL